MRLLHHFLALTASLGFVSADDAVLEARKQESQCGITGSRVNQPYFVSSQASLQVPDQCGALCKARPLCQSYAVEKGYCRLYRNPVITKVIEKVPGNNTFYDKECTTNTDMCQVNGFRTPSNQAFSSSTKLTDNNYKGCSALCKATAGCQAFSLGVETGGACRLYKNPLVQDFTPDPDNTDLYWDVKCQRDVAEPGPALKFNQPSAVPSIGKDQATVTFAPAETPTRLSTDSPAYTPSGPQVAPDDDDEFMSTYTFEEFELATVKAMGSAPITTGIPQPTAIPTAPCMVQAGAQAQFTVLNENFIPMVSRASNSVGPMLQPTKAPAPNDPVLSPEDLELPGFYLQAAPGASDVYDMVYAGSSPQFVAMNSRGNIVLTGSSTGTSFQNDLVTSIFKVDCFGVISITQGGSSWTWQTTGASSTLVKDSSGAKNMKALPKVIPAVAEARKNRRSNQVMAEKLAKRNSYTEGPAPKCPNSPPDLVAGTKAGYEYGAGNFCENLSEYWSISPFSFDGSCAVQSLCYDQCASFGWQSCNGIFGTMMILSCLDVFDSWWEVIPAVACVAQASYFTGVAATSKGRELFYKSQKSMCRCFCSNPKDTCAFSETDFYCTDIHGNDDENCGNCGRTCGPNTKCRNGNCGCPKDQCGTTCLDFRNNPKNCGSCGKVCDSGYCLDGRCYTPQPGDCLPDQSVTNNNFDLAYPTFVNWTMAAYPGCTLGSNINFSPTNYLAGGKSDPAVLVAMTSLPGSGCQAAMTQNQVKMCPSTKYELTFAMGYVNKVGNDMVTSNADCTVRWLTGPPDSWNNNGGFQSSPDYKIGLNNGGYKTFGPWSLHVSEGETGVTKVKKSFYVNLTAVINCGNAQNGAGRFIIRDVQLNPVGSAKARSVEVRGVVGGNATAGDILEELKPYYPDVQPGDELTTSFVARTARLRLR